MNNWENKNDKRILLKTKEKNIYNSIKFLVSQIHHETWYMYVIFLNAYLRMEEEEHRKDTGASREEASGLNRGICSLTTCRQVQNVHTASPLPSTRYQLALLFSPCFTTT